MCQNTNPRQHRFLGGANNWHAHGDVARTRIRFCRAQQIKSARIARPLGFQKHYLDRENSADTFQIWLAGKRHFQWSQRMRAKFDCRHGCRRFVIARISRSLVRGSRIFSARMASVRATDELVPSHPLRQIGRAGDERLPAGMIIHNNAATPADRGIERYRVDAPG
jgi:hypothetical protein